MQSKICRTCHQEKPVDEFHRQTRSPDGRQESCVSCNKRQAREREWQKKGLRITYGQYERMVAAQGGGCAICGRKPEGRDLNVDHDPQTGVVRGLLCGACDAGLDAFGNDAGRLARAGSYIDQGGPKGDPGSD